MEKPQDYINKNIVIAVDTLKGIRQYLGRCKEVTFLGKDTKGDEVYNYMIVEDKTDKIYCFSTNQIKFIGLWTKKR